MPTPDEAGILPPSPPPEATASGRDSFIICPPDETRESHAQGEMRTDMPLLEALETFGRRRDGRAHMQEPTPEPEPDVRHNAPEQQAGDVQEKEERSEANGSTAVDGSPMRVGSPEVSSDVGVDARAEQALALAGLDMAEKDLDESAPRYICYPPLSRGERIQPHSTSSFLKPGSKFRGTQRSDKQVYDVQVEIKDVDLEQSFLCGYLRIQGLTDDHPTLTTFFEGEIIGPKYLFRTTHASWNSSEKVDLEHWARFPPFRPLARYAKSNPASFTLKKYLEREHLFMRWKEYFLVPDHRVKSISGASFEGFYYICFNQCVGSVSGIYFHAKSEKYQQLELHHVSDNGCMAAIEFR